GVGKELFQRRARHRPPPHHSTVRRSQEPYRKKLNAVLFDGKNDIPAVNLFYMGLLSFAIKHGGNGRTENIGINQPHAGSGLRERNRKIRRYGRLADTAFSGSNGNDVFYARKDWRITAHCRYRRCHGYLKLIVADNATYCCFA